MSTMEARISKADGVTLRMKKIGIKMKRSITGILIALAALMMFSEAGAQNLTSYKRMVKELSSAKFQGRGYARNGVRKAGLFIEREFSAAGADEIMLQPFKIDINTFPGKMNMTVDGKSLAPGRDFTMREYSPGVQGYYKLYYIDTLNFNLAKITEELCRPANLGAFVVCDFEFTYRHKDVFKRLESRKCCQNSGMIYIWNEPLKFYKAYGEKVVEKPIIWVSSDFPKNARNVSLDIENEFLKGYTSNNVIAKVNGCRHDSCFVFTAHYDHLGNLGSKVFYPGANDNASGTAAIITLAEYYSSHRPKFDIYFIAFSGEDANLRGSKWFTEHPVMPLESIKYLINIDMIGDNNPEMYCKTSDTGTRGYEVFSQINDAGHFFKALKRGELAANSDHYPFAAKGVPCIFFENEGGDAFKHYHTPQDNWQNAVFDSYEPLFKLVTGFIREY